VAIPAFPQQGLRGAENRRAVRLRRRPLVTKKPRRGVAAGAFSKKRALAARESE
jgi:hypothetical protein